jgi:serine protease Do
VIKQYNMKETKSTITTKATENTKSSTAKVSKESKKPKNNSNNTNLAKSILLVLIAVTAGFFGGWMGGQSNSNSGNNNAVERQIVESEGNLINQIATDVSPSVVSVNVVSNNIGQDFFGFDQSYESQSAGTGFIISKDGIVVTNRHVVPETEAEITVVMSDGTELPAEVIGRTNDSDPLDIAFLKITDTKGKELVPANLGDSDKVQVGDRVVAIGNALGQFQNTVTSGIISGYGRDIEASDGGGANVESLQNLFQTDAAINSGNSGGPLVNSASEVIGINVATARADNISFAIPINDVKSLIEIVLSTGKLERPYLGVRYIPLNEDIADQLGIEQTSGAYIPEGSTRRPSIIPGSPADEAGILVQDIILEINGQKIDDDNGLVSILSKNKVGDTVDMKILRGEQELTIPVTLQAVPEQ